MASVTFAVDEEVKKRLSKFLWVNWSVLAREELTKRAKKIEALEKLSLLLTDSEMTEELSLKMDEESKERIYKRIKSRFK
ncbi:hypothetical protein J4402_04215 [Candidatus Pacearchaeota archaeon]|nr:hypothetical protein [Candidatus Pacearchaeota archaeon]